MSLQDRTYLILFFAFCTMRVICMVFAGFMMSDDLFFLSRLACLWIRNL